MRIAAKLACAGALIILGGCSLFSSKVPRNPPAALEDFKSTLNPHSLEVITAKLEPSLKDATLEERYQFERLAYFALDKDSTDGKLIFNRTITLRDTWAKETHKG